MEVYWPYPHNECQPTSQDGISLAGKEKTRIPRETWRRPAEKERIAFVLRRGAR